MNADTTREAWLEAAIKGFRPMFDQIGFPLPATIHVSVGFGFGTKAESKHIAGQTTHSGVSVDGANHVFISPEVDDTAYVLALMLHELAHVALDNEDGHKGRFAEMMTRLGMMQPFTQAIPDIALAAELMIIAAELGDYRHAKLDMVLLRTPVAVGPDGQPVGPRTTSGPRAQTNRHIKIVCPEHSAYCLRGSRAVLEMAMPSCGLCGSEMKLA